MLTTRTSKFCFLLLVNSVLSACGGGSGLASDWKTAPIISSGDGTLSQIISNHSATITVAYSVTSMTWVNDQGRVLGTKRITIDPQLVGNESIKSSTRKLVQQSGQWTLRSLLELTNGNQLLVSMPVDFDNGYAAESSGFLPGKTIQLEQPISTGSSAFELSNGHWLFFHRRSNEPVLDVVEFSAEGALVANNQIDTTGLPFTPLQHVWLTNTDSLRIGSDKAVYSVEGNQLVTLWNTATDCGTSKSFFNDSTDVPIRNEAGEALLGCGDDTLIRIQADGSILQYPVELPSNAVTLLEANYLAKPNGVLWLAITYSPTACNPDGSCSGALLNSRGLIKRYSLNGNLEIDNNKSVGSLGFIGTMPNGYILNDDSALFITYKGEGGYTLVDNSGTPRWSAFVPGPFLTLYQAGPAYLAPTGHLYLASQQNQEIYRFNTEKR